MFISEQEAQTQFLLLLDRTAKGERFVITRQGITVAVLSPVSERYQAIEQLKAFQRGKQSGGALGAMIEEGRR